MKRLIDIMVALLAFFVLLLPIILLACLVAFKIGRPIYFSQIRPGLYGKPFRIIKFRTMNNELDSDGHLLPDAQRLSSFGRFLRASSLDELPELWNVIKGDMSLVGPRPLLMEYLPLYTEEQARRHNVRPGITGWAQVNGRNAISWEEKFKLDVWYVENQSFFLDVKILALTILKVIKRHGISAQEEVTMTKFTVSKP